VVMKNDQNEMIPIEEFSKVKGVPVEKLIGMIQDGFYSGKKVGDHWFVYPSEINQGVSIGSNERSRKESSHVREFRKSRMNPSEEIVDFLDGWIGEMMGSGENEQHNGYLILTNERLCFYRKGLTGEIFKPTPLSSIANIETLSRMGYRNLRIFTSQGVFSFKTFEKRESFLRMCSNIEARQREFVPQDSLRITPAISNDCRAKQNIEHDFVDVEIGEKQDSSEEKKVGFWLGLGIFSMPYFLSWVTLRNGYSLSVRLVSFAWLGIFMVGILSDSDSGSSVGSRDKLPGSSESELMYQCTEQAKSLLNYPASAKFPISGVIRRDVLKENNDLYTYILVREVEASNAFGVLNTEKFYCEAKLVRSGSGWGYNIKSAYFY
jgi:hypothetical protein